MGHVSRSVPVNVGLALPLRALQLGSPDGWDFGWCAVDANDRVIGYAMTEAQAKQLVAPFAAASEKQPSMGRTGLEERYEAALRHVAENAFAGKDWKFAQLILSGRTVDEAKEEVRNLYGR